MLINVDDAVFTLENYSRTLTEDASSYWLTHKKRFVWLAELLLRLVNNSKDSDRPIRSILDIGNSFQTMLFEMMFPSIKIDTMGFLDNRYAPKDNSVHIPFDLNDVIYEDKRPVIKNKYDVIVMAEVIEHLYTSPITVLSMLREILYDSGFLIVQTPNAVSLSKRYSMLVGNNPFELIREQRYNPGHFREYTKYELCSIAHQAGYITTEVHMVNYFKAKDNLLVKYLPKSFKDGITIVLKKNG